MAQGDIDPASPTAQIQAYLQAQGLPLTAQNVHNVLMANAMGTGGAGQTLPGVVNQAPPSEDVGVGQRGNVARKVEKGVSTGPMDRRDDTAAASTTPETSAPPVSQTDLGSMITLGLPALGLGANELARRSLRMPGPPELGAGAGPMPSIGVTPDPAQITADQYRLLPAPETQTPFDRAMGRAVPPDVIPMPDQSGGAADINLPPRETPRTPEVPARGPRSYAIRPRMIMR